MPVSYMQAGAGTASFLIPAPFVNITKNYDKSGSGEILGVKYSITLTGTLLHDRGSPTSGGTFLTADATETGVGGDAAYKSIQNKQKAIMNLFSKKNEGGELYIQDPSTGGSGFKCYPRIISVDMPNHNPGNPTISTYTVSLEADFLRGPGTVNDDDDWDALNKWLISSASENWNIAENEGGKVITIVQNNTGPITKIEKTYSLTRSISATGKAKFDENSAAADGFKSDGFSTQYDKTGAAEQGEAWQQARGFVYDILNYGNIFLADSVDGYERDKYGVNLPPGYEGYNYVRNETVDELSGTFSINESWILLPPGHDKVTETVESSVSQSQDTGILKVTINGSIQGMGTKQHNSFSGDNRVGSTEEADTVVDFAEKYKNAKARFTAIEGNLYLVAQNLLRDSSEFGPNDNTGTSLNQSPTSKTITRNPYTGIVTYSMEFDNRRAFAIPGVKSENISINDTYPGYVAAVTQVIGRALGPVLQSIGTQTQWQRSLTIECVVDTNTLTSANFIGNPPQDYYGGVISAKPSHVQAQRDVIIDIIKKFDPGSNKADPDGLGKKNINAWFTEAPSESWNPLTGAWTYSVSWTYEQINTYQFFPIETSRPFTSVAAPHPKTSI